MRSRTTSASATTGWMRSARTSNAPVPAGGQVCPGAGMARGLSAPGLRIRTLVALAWVAAGFLYELAAHEAEHSGLPPFIVALLGRRPPTELVSGLQRSTSLTRPVAVCIMSAIMTTLSARRAIARILLLLLLLAMVSGTGASGEAAGTASFTVEYPMPGSPYHVAVEAPNLVWATLPAQNAIVRLEVTSPDLYEVALFELPMAGSEPYDIAVAAGRVWVTERTGNRIGSLDSASDPATPAWTEYSIPTADSEPTGITVIVGEPIEVWFAERAGNKLGRLLVSGAGDAVFDEYALPYANAYPESVSAISSEPIWFSAPGISSIYRFRLSRWPWSTDAFASVPTGNGSQPWDIKVGADGQPWLTEPNGNRIGKYTPGTLTYFTWYNLPSPNSGPNDLDIAQGSVWFVEKDGNRIGKLYAAAGSLYELVLPASVPTGVAVDANGCAWVAASGQDAVISWCPPYFHSAYLPRVSNK